MALNYYVSILTLFYLKNVRMQRCVMEHHGPNYNSNVTTPVVLVRSYTKHLRREAC